MLPAASACYLEPVIEFTDWAMEILRQSQSASSRFNPAARIRLQLSKTGAVEAALVDELDTTDTTVDAGGVTIYVQAGLEGLVDVEEPHDRIVLKPEGSAPNIRGEH
jgi:hypothetical protein